MGLSRSIWVGVFIALSSCQSTRHEMFQGEPIPLKPNQVLVNSIQQRNFEIWCKNEKAFAGMKAFKSTGPCPSTMGHGHGIN